MLLLLLNLSTPALIGTGSIVDSAETVTASVLVEVSLAEAKAAPSHRRR
jgi:hypothetical protein